MRRRRLGSSICAIVFAAFAAGVAGSDRATAAPPVVDGAEGSPVPGALRVVETIALRAAADSEPGLPAVQLGITAEGRRVVTFTIEVAALDRAGRKGERFQWTVDPVLREYRIRRLHRLAKSLPPAGVPSRGHVTEEGTRTGAATYLLDCYSAAEGIHEDPLFIDLAKTRSNLEWLRGGGHVPCASSSSGQCIPVCPTPLNTCWG